MRIKQKQLKWDKMKDQILRMGTNESGEEIGGGIDTKIFMIFAMIIKDDLHRLGCKKKGVKK